MFARLCAFMRRTFFWLWDHTGEVRLDGSDKTYKVGGVTYTVGSKFSGSVTLKSRLERYIKANASELTADTSRVIIEEEYVSAVGKENNNEQTA